MKKILVKISQMLVYGIVAPPIFVSAILGLFYLFAWVGEVFWQFPADFENGSSLIVWSLFCMIFSIGGMVALAAYWESENNK